METVVFRNALREFAYRLLTPGGRWLLADFIALGFMKPILSLLRLHQLPDRGRAELIATLGLGRERWTAPSREPVAL
jgi:hypothetical protein